MLKIPLLTTSRHQHRIRSILQKGFKDKLPLTGRNEQNQTHVSSAETIFKGESEFEERKKDNVFKYISKYHYLNVIVISCFLYISTTFRHMNVCNLYMCLL